MFLRVVAKAKARTERPVFRLRADLAWRARLAGMLRQLVPLSLPELRGCRGVVIRECGHSLDPV